MAATGRGAPLTRRPALLAGLLGAILAASCGPSADTAPAATRLPQDTLVRASSDELRSLDPHKVSTVDDIKVMADLYEGLTRLGADGRVEPGLAERWQVSADGLDWRFTLRPGLRFADGTTLTARDVVTSLRRLLAPATAAPNASLFFAIANAEAVASGTAAPETLGVQASDARTVTIRLQRPLPAFAELLAHASAVVLPGAALDRHGDAWIKQRPLASSGPFRLRQWRLHSALTLERNPHYHDAGNVALAGVVYRPLPDDQSALRQFRAGALDILPDFPARDLALVRRDIPSALRLAPYRGSYYFAFNTRQPPFNDVRVRRALTMSVDRHILVHLVIGLDQPQAFGVVPPGLGGYGPAVLPGYAGWPMARRLDEARRLLHAAGYGPDRPLTFEIRYNSDVEHRRIALALTQMWKPLGVRARLVNAEAAIHFAMLRAGDFSLARSGWIADYAGAENFLSIFMSNAGPLNYPGYANPDYDRDVMAAMALADPVARNHALRRAEARLVEDVPVLPLYHYVSKSLVGPRVEGWTDNLANVHPSRTLRLRPPPETAR